jgi:hypothetical protein
MYTPSMFEPARSQEHRHHAPESERELFQYAAREAVRARRAQRRERLRAVRLGAHRISRPAVAISALIAGAFIAGYTV